MHRILFLIICLFMLISPVMGEIQQYRIENYNNLIIVERDGIKEGGSRKNNISPENQSFAEKEDRPLPDRLFNLTLVYTAQWGFYYASQYNNIHTNGSFQNWRSNLFTIHFDKDNYNYNLIKHTLAGSSYYLFKTMGYIINPFALFHRDNLQSQSGSYVSNDHIGYYFTIKI